MSFIKLTPEAEPRVLIALPEANCSEKQLVFLKNRVLTPANLDIKEVVFYAIPTPLKKKHTKAELVDIVVEIHEYCETYGISTIAVGQATLYTALTGNKKPSLYYGKAELGTIFKYVKEKIVLDFTSYTLIPFLNPAILKMYPNKTNEVNRGLQTIKRVLNGTYKDSNEYIDAIEKNEILTNSKDVQKVLVDLFYKDRLFVDIETTGLEWYKDRLLTLSFAVNEKEAYCIAIHPQYHSEEEYLAIKDLLKRFFSKYQGTLVGHNWIGFDQAFIVHEILRNNDFSIRHEKLCDLIKMEDTMLMAYILKNSIERNSIGLKELSFKYLGEYDKEIDQKKLASYPLNDVATYNNYDVIATALIYKELKEQIEKEGEHFITLNKKYQQIAVDLLKMKMNGLRVDKHQAQKVLPEVKVEIEKDKEELLNNEYVKEATQILKKLGKIKEGDNFNPQSPVQKRTLFFTVMQLPVIKKSKESGEPSTDKEVISEWSNSPDISEDKKRVIELLKDYSLASKAVNSYIETLANEVIKVGENDWRVFANFNQTGTISGRLSSSGMINLQTIPSSSKYASVIKKLLIAPEGMIIATADYSALEDRLMANASGDENKINIFKKGIDGHCLNAYGYFKDEFIRRGIVIENPSDPEQINKIKELAPDLRQQGKPYTFGLSYGAGPDKYGKDIYNNYWQLYRGVRNYLDKQIAKAKRNGYIISQFSGLRLIVPEIKDNYLKEKSERVVGNFSIQSGNFLMLEAVHIINKWIKNNNLYDKVQIVNSVHDSVYLYVKEDLELIKEVNQIVINAMIENYNLTNPPVLLEAELDLGYNMKEFETIPNNCDIDIIKETINKLKNKKGDENE